jgi:hypothetical protein
MALQCGRKKSTLEKQLLGTYYDFTYLNKEKWWRSWVDTTEYGPNVVEKFETETKDEIGLRIALLLLLIALKEV